MVRKQAGSLIGMTVFVLAAALAVSAQSSPFGEVSFANSGAPAAQADFLRGLALLHDFEFPAAAKAFRQAEAADPNFAMAYWGEAMSYNHPLWAQQDAPAARAALKRLAPTPEERLAKAKTQREKDYLHAVEILYGEGDKYDRDDRYSEAMAEVHRKYPDDVDATAFYALSILGTAHSGRDFATYMRAAALLEEVFPTHPRHPGVVHYLIHSYDDPIHAPLGLRAARIYSKIAPGAAHAQHMTSHIFVAMGMWDDVVKANENAVRVSVAAMGSSYPRCGHYPLWLEYGYLQQGRVEQARQALATCNADAHGSPDAWGEMRNRYLLDGERWNGEAAKWKLREGAPAEARVTYEFGNGFVAAQRGDTVAAGNSLEALRAARLEAAAQTEKEYSNAARKRAEILEHELQALIDFKAGKRDEAITLLQGAVAAAHDLPFEFGPPAIDKPVDELLGELLLAAGKHAEAQKAFEESLARTPGRMQSLRGLQQSAKLAGDHPAAERAAQQLSENLKNADSAAK